MCPKGRAGGSWGAGFIWMRDIKELQRTWQDPEGSGTRVFPLGNLALLAGKQAGAVLHLPLVLGVCEALSKQSSESVMESVIPTAKEGLPRSSCAPVGLAITLGQVSGQHSLFLAYVSGTQPHAPAPHQPCLQL